MIFLYLSPMKLNAQENVYSDTLIHILPQDKETSTDYPADNYFLTKEQRQGQEDSFELRQLPPGELRKLREDDAFWYANADIKKEAEKKSTHIPLIEQGWFQTLLWLVIIGGFAAFIMIYLENSKVWIFGRKNRSIKDAALEQEAETDDIFAINYQKEIDKAIAKGNYRLAVRLLFLRLLRQLSDKKVIQYRQGRTNFEYLMQLNPTAYYNDFFRITRNYEYSWYGQFDVSQETFSIIQKDVESFEKKIKQV